jgi:hypothetical protein
VMQCRKLASTTNKRFSQRNSLAMMSAHFIEGIA